MSSVEQKAIDSLSDNLSESLGLQGVEKKANDQPLHDNIEIQSEVERSPENKPSSSMDTHQNLPTSSPTLPSSTSMPTFFDDLDGCIASRPIRSSIESISSSVDGGDSLGATYGAINNNEFIEIPLFSKTKIFDEEYRMDHPHRGKCLIFNHKDFVGVSSRNGTDLDAYTLEKCFKDLGFDVNVYKDLKFTELQDVLLKVSQSDHSDSDCFVCCILTHGEDENLHASDLPYSKRYVFELFTGDKCPSLKNKPKVFLIQACRGRNEDTGVLMDCQTDAATVIAEPINPTQTIPIWADFLISYSTVEGYFSYRSPSSGGWFVQSLVPLLGDYGAHYDLVSILTRVNMEVALNYEAKPKGKQIPQTVHTLTKKLVFRRKNNQMIRPSTISYQVNLIDERNFENSNNSQGASNYP